jgi:hypothetical protein
MKAKLSSPYRERNAESCQIEHGSVRIGRWTQKRERVEEYLKVKFIVQYSNYVTGDLKVITVTYVHVGDCAPDMWCAELCSVLTTSVSITNSESVAFDYVSCWNHSIQIVEIITEWMCMCYLIKQLLRLCNINGEWMSMENWWDDSDKRKWKYSEKNLSQCHFVWHKSPMDWPGF